MRIGNFDTELLLSPEYSGALRVYIFSFLFLVFSIFLTTIVPIFSLLRNSKKSNVGKGIFIVSNKVLLFCFCLASVSLYLVYIGSTRKTEGVEGLSILVFGAFGCLISIFILGVSVLLNFLMKVFRPN